MIVEHEKYVDSTAKNVERSGGSGQRAAAVGINAHNNNLLSDR